MERPPARRLFERFLRGPQSKHTPNETSRSGKLKEEELIGAQVRKNAQCRHAGGNGSVQHVIREVTTVICFRGGQIGGVNEAWLRSLM